MTCCAVLDYPAHHKVNCILYFCYNRPALSATALVGTSTESPDLHLRHSPPLNCLSRHLCQVPCSDHLPREAERKYKTDIKTLAHERKNFTPHLKPELKSGFFVLIERLHDIFSFQDDTQYYRSPCDRWPEHFCSSLSLLHMTFSLIAKQHSMPHFLKFRKKERVWSAC